MLGMRMIRIFGGERLGKKITESRLIVQNEVIQFS